MISVSGILLLTFCLTGSSKGGKCNYHFINNSRVQNSNPVIFSGARSIEDVFL